MYCFFPQLAREKTIFAFWDEVFYAGKQIAILEIWQF